MNKFASGVTVSVIEWNSAAYLRCLDLRNEELRRGEGLEELRSAPLDEASCVHLAASDGADIVGTMHLRRVDDGEVAIKQVVVARSHRGRGVGADMIAFAERVARDLGYTSLTLNGTIGAWGFYDRIGFEACGPTFAWLKTTCRPYRKQIEPLAASRIRCSRGDVACGDADTPRRPMRSQIHDLHRHHSALVRKQTSYRRAAAAAGV